jgi:hypothetical protein
MIAYCGIDCEKCEAFIATVNNDDELRAKVAKQWSKTYQTDFKPEQINCTGCTSDGVKFSYCERLCKIRHCAAPRNIKTCADCDMYPCEDLGDVFRFAPDAKKLLDSLKSK